LESAASAAIEIGRAISTIASRADGSPIARISPGSSRSRPGRAARGAVPTLLASIALIA
jgi:hypothetical protein